MLYKHRTRPGKTPLTKLTMRVPQLLCLATLLAMLVLGSARQLQSDHNRICQKSDVPGSYSPIKVSDVPRSFADLVAQHFVTTTPGFDGCKEVKAKLLEACAQVTAGTTYDLLVRLTCRSPGTFGNGDEAATVLAVVNQPADTKQDPQVVHMQALSHKDDDDADDEDESFNYNHLCSSPSNGMAGAYFPTKPDSVPEGVAEAVLEKFLAGNATIDGQTFEGCPGYDVAVVQACQQVVAGTNYRLLLSVTCSNGTWENGAKAVVVEATAFQPLPNSNEPTSVSAVEVRGVLAEGAGSDNTICQQKPQGTGIPMIGGYTPTDPAALPDSVSATLLGAAATAVSGSPCSQYAMTISQSCSQLVAGTNYRLEAEVECMEGSFLARKEVKAVQVQAEIFVPLPFKGTEPELTAVTVDLL